MSTTTSKALRIDRETLLTRMLLVSGTVSSLIYVALNVFVPMLWPEYSCITQTVSELSAIGSPTRSIWFPFGVLYAVSFGLFGVGIIRVARDSRAIRTIGILTIIYSCFSLYWPPMHLRGMETSLTDTLHIVWTIVTVVLMVIMMSLGAVVFERSFKIYTIVSVFLLIVFGILTSMEAPNIVLNRPTPTIGVWERINIGLFMVWIIVLSMRFLRRETDHHDRNAESISSMYASAAFHKGAR